ncbi:uncharacterized protein GLRG_09065 [Colletotrichum graminicola M1.001]|uniref:Uncharacterized protein n=1 Tax=Colletotrichum graminicola (strain M1.001 / M2 / FGSC 10212) TaxID=645133 RepID=E3QST3_COLGM|nr:uncharacterized protein GLRG_09065 [Colletotrichum graminicola M1.001]EFQ33921.1 hypothetical protein GLRG_09065 [Colletotrichum graminicola M1.001]
MDLAGVPFGSGGMTGMAGQGRTSGAATGKMHDGTRYPTKKPNNDMQRICIIAARLVDG